jgi:DNA-directed RNA polymerase specialized sigma subunit
MVSHE